MRAATATPTLAPAAHAYITAALDIMAGHALYRGRVDWAAVRREAFARASGAQTPAETYPAIRWALAQLGDSHSALVEPAVLQHAAAATPDPGVAAAPQARLVTPGVAYLALPMVSGSTAVTTAYLERGTATLRTLPSPCGWVLDLRGNSGGDMWPMLAVVGPVLGEGEVGAFVDPDGRRQTWAYRGGQVFLAGEVVTTVPAPIPSFAAGPVAILTDRATASSGEAIAVAFRGRPETRSFGESTNGVPTANAGYPLADGGLLLLTIARMADRTGRAYDDRLAPDEAVTAAGTPGDPTSDAALRAALTWLADHAPCVR